MAPVPVNTAVILAGGLGTRLRTTFAEGPKSMAPIAGAPFLHYLLNYLKAWNVVNVVLCVGYKRTYVRQYFRSGSKYGLHIEYAVEETLRGTGGAIANAIPHIQSEYFWVLNGDTFCDVDLKDMQAFHLERVATVTLALAEARNAARYGSVSVDHRGAITGFEEKAGSAAPRASGKQLINAGLYLCSHRMLSLPIMRTQMFSLEKDLFPSLAGKGLYGCPVESSFIDIGVPTDYELAQHLLPTWFRQSNYDSPC